MPNAVQRSLLAVLAWASLVAPPALRAQRQSGSDTVPTRPSVIASVAPDSMRARRAALAQAAAAADTAALATLHEAIGLAHWRLDRFDSALVHLLRAREFATRRADSTAIARLANSLGSTHYQAGSYEAAISYYVEALALRAAAGNVVGQSYIYANIGKAYQDWRQFDRALAATDSAVALGRRGGDGHALGYAENTRAGVLVTLGRYPEAREAVGRSLAAYNSGRPPLDAVDSASAWSINELLLGRIAVLEGNADEAIRRFGGIYATALRGGTRRGQAQAQLGLGAAYLSTGDARAAATAFRLAYEAAAAIGNRAQRLEALDGLARAEQAAGRVTAALAALRERDGLRDSIFDARTSQRLATAEAEAEAARQRAQAEAQAANLRRQRVVTALMAAVALLAVGLLATLWGAHRATRRRESELALRNAELQAALTEVQVLSGFIPICASCKQVRDDEGYWQSLEQYVASRSTAQFSHSICNDCGPKLYGDDWGSGSGVSGSGGTGHGAAGPEGTGAGPSA